MKKLLISVFTVIVTVLNLSAQPIIHSHNDYKQKVPFWEAYQHSANSIEVDLYLYDGKLVVCHDKEEVESAPTFEKLYISPMVELGDSAKGFDLLIDFKMDASEMMQPLCKLLENYPKIFNNNGVKVIISGLRPAKESWSSYPDYILFDGRCSENYTSEEVEKLGMVSDELVSYTDWNGKGMIPPSHLDKMKIVIEKAHSIGKPIRFWGCGDHENTWIVLNKIGVDVINSDNIAKCSDFFANYDKSFYRLEQEQHTYTPTYKSDGKKGKPKNIILIIGDGMSITQITAAETANRGNMTLLNMKNIGFQKTWSANSYTTDSAAAGSALATGEKTNNRYISVTPDTLNAKNIENSSEAFSKGGRKIGIISTGDITDATPAAQYGHAIERNNSQEIAAYMLNEKVDLLAGSGSGSFTNRKDGRNLFSELEKKGYSILSDAGKIGDTKGRIVCIDDAFARWTTETTINFLADVTNSAIKNLDNKKGFYMMVEAAKIDYAGHANQTKGVVLEGLLLDQAVKAALEFADKDGNTLVIVTADHETGALTILEGNRESGEVNGHFASNDHTGVLIPVFAYGVGAEDFKGVYENTDVYKKIKYLLSE